MLCHTVIIAHIAFFYTRDFTCAEHVCAGYEQGMNRVMYKILRSGYNKKL